MVSLSSSSSSLPIFFSTPSFYNPDNKIALSLPIPRRRTCSVKTSASIRADIFNPPTTISINLSSSSSTLYDTLGVEPTATFLDIKKAYRRLARACHPDAVAGSHNKDISAHHFMKIHSAYLTLSDPAKRASYDRDYLLFVCTSTAAAASSAADGSRVGFTRRNWETDQCW